MLVRGTWTHVEIKYCTSHTINHVGAIKFIPLVVYSPNWPGGPWCVLSPREIVRLVVGKERGQHAEIAFECATLSRKDLPANCWCSDLVLKRRVSAAIRSGREDVNLRGIMRKLEKAIGAVRDRFRKQVLEALKR